ncbi:LysR family transcriptional regulator [Paenibacillus doosanensis]|uniref:HTH-type transcriptional regulator CynR n=1 Tax=Paenibacillus konkukensis TaxID=2020716 RepID=A0ABY4RLV0_9BACL|nr:MULTISPECIES: LysR family transcriptional regulator [Paenibacillus]MCS7463158.1 LysR family transcriptional regulator [Paenibacillus doosanensis]UQZ83000.1 HTH-type transcriptional regulator CynR [Paenibacillus konkukensis]
MDLKQLEYIVKIAEENNITRAAEKLFITQSALNQQLLKLEKELGAPLFVRSRNNWHLTEAGEIYVDHAKRIMRLKKDAYSRIKDIIGAKEGKLTIGLTPERGTDMFAAIYPAFYKLYPHVKIEPLEMPVKQQQLEISRGQLDIGFLTLQDFQKTDDCYIPIGCEPIILAVPQAHPLAHKGGKLGEALPPIPLSALAADSFAIMQQGSTLREIYDRLTAEEGVEPNILLESRSCRTLFEMVAEGICCSVIPMSYAKPDAGVSFFALSPNPVWEVAASYKKGSYLSLAARELIALSAGYWSGRLTGQS